MTTFSTREALLFFLKGTEILFYCSVLFRSLDLLCLNINILERHCFKNNTYIWCMCQIFMRLLINCYACLLGAGR